MSDDAILSRLAKLERSNRRLKIGAATCLVALAAAVFIGAERQPGPIVAGEEIRLVDPAGRVRAVLGCDREGTFFFLNDEMGRMRASMAAQKGQTYMNVKDDQDRVRAGLSFDENGAAFRLRDEARNPMATIAADNQGAFLQLRDPEGRARVLSPLSDVTSEPKK